MATNTMIDATDITVADTDTTVTTDTTITTDTTPHNFKVGIDKSLIPLLIGSGGKNLYHKVINASIEELQKDYEHQAVKGDIKLRITIKNNDAIGTYASWKDTESLGPMNVVFNEIIKKKLTDVAVSINDFDSKKKIELKVKKIELKVKKGVKSEPLVKKYRQNFNYRMDLGKCSIGQFIGNGGDIINSFKQDIADKLKVDKVFIKIDEYDDDKDYQCRVIGNTISDIDIVFEIGFYGGDRSDIHIVQKMLINFVNGIYEDDNEDDNEDDDNDSVNSD